MYKKIIKQLANLKWETIISKDSIISPNIEIGSGSVILGNSFIGTGTKIKEHCIINSSNSIDHDNFFEKRVTEYAKSGVKPNHITNKDIVIDADF